LDCFAYGTEETTNTHFEFVVREIHNAKCGGDPETKPAINRYRVYRWSGKIRQWEALKTNGSRISRPQSKQVRTQVAPAESGREHDFCR
jgi:hypothetical protein